MLHQRKVGLQRCPVELHLPNIFMSHEDVKGILINIAEDLELEGTVSV